MAIIALAVLGLCLGSFTNAVVWRVHQQSLAKNKKDRGKYSISKGHSMCPHCRYPLQVQDLVPVLSWIELRGRCRYCRAKISWQYPLVEILMASLFLLSLIFWPFSFSFAGVIAFGAWLACLVILVALTVYDIRWMLLPDRLVLPLTWLTLLLVSALMVEQGNPSNIYNPLLGALFLSGLFWLLFQVSSGKWIGGGDVKMAVALGLISGGLIESILLLFIASLLGTVISIPLLLAGKQATHKVPFGPFLIVATIIVFFSGSMMIDWYSSLIGV